MDTSNFRVDKKDYRNLETIGGADSGLPGRSDGTIGQCTIGVVRRSARKTSQASRPGVRQRRSRGLRVCDNRSPHAKFIQQTQRSHIGLR